MSRLIPKGTLFPKGELHPVNIKDNSKGKVEIDISINEQELEKIIDEQMKKVVKKLNSK